MLIDPQADRIFEDWEQPSVPGGAVAVLKNGELVHCRGYGLGNLETATPFQLNHRFCIASVTKQFTTLCILLLQERGLLDLDGDVRCHFPELAEFRPPITIRHLCHNSSGLRDYIALAPLAGGQLLEKLHRPLIMELIANQHSLNFAPGSQYRYSNTNFFILGIIIERLSGMPLGEAFEKWIFQPLGMTSSLLVDDPRCRPDNAVQGYQGDSQSGFKRWGWDCYGSGDGGIWSTMNDMLLWERNFLRNVIGKPGLTERLSDTTPLSGGLPNNYGFGLHTGRYRGKTWHGHGGGFAGFMSHRMRFPDDRLSVIIFANHTDNLIERSFRVADLFLDQPLAIREASSADLNETEFHRRLGYYQDLQSGIGFELGLDNNTPVLDIFGLRRALHDKTNNRFGAAPRSNWNGWVELGSLGPTPTMTVSMEQGAWATVSRVQEARGGLQPFEGVFRNDELQASYTLEVKDQVLCLSCDGMGGLVYAVGLERKGPESFVLDPHNRDCWSLDGRAVFWFPEEPSGQRNSLVVSCYAAEGIRFKRSVPC